jgi:hypothetical protein
MRRLPQLLRHDPTLRQLDLDAAGKAGRKLTLEEAVKRAMQ